MKNKDPQRDFITGDVLKKAQEDRRYKQETITPDIPKPEPEPVIKFSSDYCKLPHGWEGTQALLIAVTLVNVPDLKKEYPAFIIYDTTYRGKKGRYYLDMTWGMILTFIHDQGTVFTTIRGYTRDKHEYYKNKIHRRFRLIKTYEGVDK